MSLTIVTFITPEYLGKLKWTLPTWNYKPQFKNIPIVIFTNGFKENYTELEFIKQYYPDWTFVDWHPINTESIRELVFSSYIFGTEFIKTDHFVKIDADTFFTTKQDIFDESDMEFDLVGHGWGYTKPGWWIPYLENFYNKTNSEIDKTQLGRFEHHRIASFCCLHKTEWVKSIASILNNKLPIPSHDTVLWFYANKIGKWKGKNVKKLGCNNSTRWKGIREEICSSQNNNNPYLNEMLLSHVQLEITTDCQLKCFNCDRNCGTAPSKENMELDQIWKFVEESLLLKKNWGRIDIIGGEPTLHPELPMIIKMIKFYKDKYPNTTIRFSTNGLGEQVKEVLKTLPNWISLRNSGKSHREQEFVAYNSAPIDNRERHIRHCSVPWRCGLGLTRYGYFPCGAGASVARVFGIDIGIKDLISVTPESIIEQLPNLCKYCGHSQVKSRHVTNKAEISKSWELAFKIYQENKMILY